MTRWIVTRIDTGARVVVDSAASAPHAARRSKLPLDRDGAIARVDPDDWEGRGVRVHRVRARSGATQTKDDRRMGRVRIEAWVSPEAATRLDQLAEVHGSRTAAIEAAVLALR